jgi:hypothetical protein
MRKLHIKSRPKVSPLKTLRKIGKVGSTAQLRNEARLSLDQHLSIPLLDILLVAQRFSFGSPRGLLFGSHNPTFSAPSEKPCSNPKGRKAKTTANAKAKQENEA